jgi:hypothetical protein
VLIDSGAITIADTAVDRIATAASAGAIACSCVGVAIDRSVDFCADAVGNAVNADAVGNTVNSDSVVSNV